MPRCPQCTYLHPLLGLCAVCASGVAVHRITEAEMQAAYDALINGITHGQQQRPFPSPVRGPRPPKPPEDRQAYACEMPGCHGVALLLPIGYRRGKGKGQPVRCPPCQAARHRESMRQSNTRYRAKRRRALEET